VGGKVEADNRQERDTAAVPEGQASVPAGEDLGPLACVVAADKHHLVGIAAGNIENPQGLIGKGVASLEQEPIWRAISQQRLAGGDRLLGRGLGLSVVSIVASGIADVDRPCICAGIDDRPTPRILIHD